MRVLGLDLSSSTGFAILDTDVQGSTGLIRYGVVETCPVYNNPTEEYRYLGIAEQIGRAVTTIVETEQVDLVVIEQSNRGKNRHTQKYIEFIHCVVLLMLQKCGMASKIHYIDTSAWRKILGQRLSKDQRAHNKQVKEGKIRGKITPKHLSVKWVNQTYGLSLKLKDNDIADAISIASAGLSMQRSLKPDKLDNQDQCRGCGTATINWLDRALFS